MSKRPDDTEGWRELLVDLETRGKLDEETCLEAVSFDGALLESVPERFKTRNVCLEAAANDWFALGYVPEKMLDAEICGEAVASGVAHGIDISNPALWSCVPERIENETRSYAEALLGEDRDYESPGM